MRLRVLDALRGGAVLLMILDHVLGATSWGLPLRLSLTRLALPAFMVVSGYLLAHRDGRRSWQRLFEVGGAGAVVTLGFWLIGFPVPDVLLVLVLTVPFWGSVVRRPLVVGSLGLLQAVNVPIGGFASWWGGYEPGYLLLWLALGVLALRAYGVPAWVESSRADFLEVVGRRPLVWYVGHVGVLVIVKGVAL